MTLTRAIALHTALTIAMTFGLATSALADTIDGYGAMGASESAGTDYTGSWIPYLANQRGFNFGGPGQPYNVAEGGATSTSLLDGGQHTDVRDLVDDGDVDLAFLFIGGNDFFAVGTQIASGALSGAALETWAQGVVDNIGTAMDTVLAAHPVGMVVAGVPDILLMPGGRAIFNNATRQARGTAAVDLVNTLLKPAVLDRGQVYLDLTNAVRTLDAFPLVVGGVTIDTVNASTDPTHFFQDNRHPAAVGNGLLANFFLEAVNVGYGTNYAPLTDYEILSTAGLADDYTGETSALPYSAFIFTPVPEPASVWLAIAAGGPLLLVYVRRRVAAGRRLRPVPDRA